MFTKSSSSSSTPETSVLAEGKGTERSSGQGRQFDRRSERGGMRGSGRASSNNTGKGRDTECVDLSHTECYYCHKLGHLKSTCPKLQRGSVSGNTERGDLSQTECHYCHKLGHIKSMCPKLQRRSVYDPGFDFNQLTEEVLKWMCNPNGPMPFIAPPGFPDCLDNWGKS